MFAASAMPNTEDLGKPLRQAQHSTVPPLKIGEVMFGATLWELLEVWDDIEWASKHPKRF